MTFDREVLTFAIGLPFGGLIALMVLLMPEVRRVVVVGTVIIFITAGMLVGLERVLEVMCNALERWLALRYFAAGTTAGAVITLLSWPRPPRTSGSAKS